MNQIATIPKKISRQGELVVLPRKEYDALVRASQPQFRPTEKQIIDNDLAKSLAEYRAGQYYGPFDTAKDGIAFLKSHKKQAQKK